jgi:hypothetical protein
VRSAIKDALAKAMRPQCPIEKEGKSGWYAFRRWLAPSWLDQNTGRRSEDECEACDIGDGETFAENQNRADDADHGVEERAE